MKLKFNKWLFSVIAIIFGFSGTVAAQYGVVENHYLIKGNVMSEKCNNAIPKIKITLRATNAKSEKEDLEVYTDEKGNFSIDNMYFRSDQDYFLIAQDTDGQANKGDFQSSRQLITLNEKDFAKTAYENWDQYYENKTTYYFGLKLKKDQPCE
ncbi:MAG TPA: radical SAM-associated putative lipoprotein [Bacteroidales bacterium]|nr:radical SAM-associated putative lipoprotein [Bacteroidales bacterium]